MLAPLNASLLYYSDHGIIQTTRRGSMRYRHGHVRFPKEALDIPMFIWFSPAVSNPARLGHLDTPFTTADNYLLIQDWLGIEQVGKPVNSPLRETYRPREKITIMNSQLKVMDYDSLPPETP